MEVAVNDEAQTARLIYAVEHLTSAVQKLDSRVSTIETLISKGRGFLYGISAVLILLGALLHQMVRILW